MKKIEAFFPFVRENCVPNLTVFMDVPVSVGLARAAKRGNHPSNLRNMKPRTTLAALLLSALCPVLAEDKPVKVYVLAGQSNMVGIGQVTSGGVRWGDEFQNPVLSVYEGDYDPKADYDALTPVETVELAAFGGFQQRPREFEKPY
jgi:hypothetical protein